jgi:hypothetical protein
VKLGRGIYVAEQYAGGGDQSKCFMSYNTAKHKKTLSDSKFLKGYMLDVEDAV